MTSTKNVAFISGAQDCARVSGLTHNFYRYPARFSPKFARAAIEKFTEPGDLVCDPFMGGGTTVVEARALGRDCFGVDVSSLAVFISRVKTTVYSEFDLDVLSGWIRDTVGLLRVNRPTESAGQWAEAGYLRNLSGKMTWRIRKILQVVLECVEDLVPNHQDFGRCLILRTAQWALDCKKEIPCANSFRQQFWKFGMEMIEGARAFASQVRQSELQVGRSHHVLCIHRSAVGIESAHELHGVRAPNLILTSPPYPGVHVLYHRWQIQGRKETPAPFWIAGTLDGAGNSFYNFGDRHQEHLVDYYDQATRAFSSVAKICSRKTTLVQLVAFSNPRWQLPLYLHSMGNAGFREIFFKSMSNSHDGRMWRAVPNRKWYATGQPSADAAREVVLFHRAR